MKRFGIIGWLMVLMVACAKPPTTDRMASPELARIDTLMQIQPDSALTLLLDEEMDDPYYQLLLSEALYKNDYAQTNRDELLAAMAYFDFVHDPFLSARCHYMNGVGFYEMDSVVPACEEYMKAIQIMEEHYTEKELVGLKAKYLALAYTRLTILFSDQYLHEQAIYFSKQALSYYLKYDVEPRHITWVLYQIGLHYDMMEQSDSALFYYDKAMAFLQDSTSLAYRDISTTKAYLSYRMSNDAPSAIVRLNKLYRDSESEEERLARAQIIGEIYFLDNCLDSAAYYLSMVFDSDSPFSDNKLKIHTAQRLRDIYIMNGKSFLTNMYTEYLAQHTTTGVEQATLHSTLNLLYSDFLLNKNNFSKNQEKKTTSFFVYVMGIILFVVLLGMTITRFLWKKQHDKTTFLKEPVCQHILNIVNDTAFKAKMDYKLYTDIALNKEQLLALRLAADKHYHGFARKLRSKYPGLTDDDLNHCCLLLLGLEEAAISGLLQKSYTAVCDRNRKLKKELGIREDLFDEIRNI